MTSDIKTYESQDQDIIQMGDHVSPTGHHGYQKGHQSDVIPLRGSLSDHYIASLYKVTRLCLTPRRDGRH